MEKKLKMNLVLFLSALILNFIWESLHIRLYIPKLFLQGWNNLSIAIYTSFIDAFLIITAYYCVFLISKKIVWELNSKNILIFTTISLIIAAYIEYTSIYRLDKWAYADAMPLIFGIGLSPLVQLAVTGLIRNLISRKIIFV